MLQELLGGGVWLLHEGVVRVDFSQGYTCIWFWAPWLAIVSSSCEAPSLKEGPGTVSHRAGWGPKRDCRAPRATPQPQGPCEVEGRVLCGSPESSCPLPALDIHTLFFQTGFHVA